jgi:hypothetical protein
MIKGIWIHKQAKKHWYKYFKPTWINKITGQQGYPKIYRWLCFGFYVA